MWLYLIVLDFNRVDYRPNNYENFRLRLQALEAQHVVTDVWVFRSDQTAEKVKDDLKKGLRERDRIVVVEFVSCANKKRLLT